MNPYMASKVTGYLEANKIKMVDLVSRLIEIPTVNPPGENYKEMVDFLERQCRALGLATKRYITPKRFLQKYGLRSGSERISLVSRWDTGARKTLHINSHYDVVPATDKWATDPFNAIIKKDRIYGRGSEDMKGTMASVLFSLKALKALNIKPRINIELSFTPDEEIGGRTGLGYLVEKGLVKADYAMSEGYSDSYVSLGNKGVIWAEVTVEGKSAHASAPHKGVNAFERMVDLARELQRLKQKIENRKTQYGMRESISRSPSLVMGGLLQGGVKTNVVPGIAKFSIDRRLIPEENINDAKKEIKSVIDAFNRRYTDSRVRVKFISLEAPAISRQDKVFFKTVSDAIKLITGRNAMFRVMSGATDLRYFMWKGIPGLGYSAKGGEAWHSDNEFVHIGSLVSTAKVYSLIISNLS
jgi:succinyl-diaminopimelate desuccinylase